MAGEVRPPTGHVFRVERARGPVWYAKYRLPDGRQVQKKIGPAWTGRGRPAGGYVTKRTADEWLRRVLDEARRGGLPGMVKTGATFGDAAAEWIRYVEQDRMRKPSTVATYGAILRSRILPAFAEHRSRCRPNPLDAACTPTARVPAPVATHGRRAMKARSGPRASRGTLSLRV